MWRAFGQLPAALAATVQIAERCSFRLPLPHSGLPDPRSTRLGPGLLFGLEPASEVGEQQLAELVERALPARFAAENRGSPSNEVLERAREEVLSRWQN
jgi:DNA polymerase III alpha subunit